MTSNPSIYILRKGVSDFPKREKCSPGDIVVMPSGDLLIWSGLNWILASGRYITVEELKEFIGYVSSGWPEDPSILLTDLSGLVKNREFLVKTAEICKELRGKVIQTP